jgi:Zn finger protein HypA/HybF involved in hydrogenase expression
MHELSVIMSVVDTVDEYLKANYGGAETSSDSADSKDSTLPRVSGVKVTRISLQVGERSSYIPAYIREIWPFAVGDTVLDCASLEIEEAPGRDFLIKEIEIEE